MAEPTGAPTPAEAGAEAEFESAAEEHSAEYTTETPAAEEPEEIGEVGEIGEVVGPRAPMTGPATGTGRRKSAVARVRLLPGSGQWRVNGLPLDGYFPNRVHQQTVSEPFSTVGAEERFDIVARVSGGGVTGQAGALRLGVARALGEADQEFRPTLKDAGFVTRDARVKERRKYGLKKARKAPQYSKR